jgi:hypothetical protein
MVEVQAAAGPEHLVNLQVLDTPAVAKAVMVLLVQYLEIYNGTVVVAPVLMTRVLMQHIQEKAAVARVRDQPAVLNLIWMERQEPAVAAPAELTTAVTAVRGLS